MRRSLTMKPASTGAVLEEEHIAFRVTFIQNAHVGAKTTPTPPKMKVVSGSLTGGTSFNLILSFSFKRMVLDFFI